MWLETNTEREKERKKKNKNEKIWKMLSQLKYFVTLIE